MSKRHGALTRCTNINLTLEEFKIINKHFPQGLVAFDLETSGLSPLVDEIIEIAAIKVVGNKVETFEELVRPSRAIPQYTTDIHGITDDMVKDAASIDEVLPRFLDFANGHSLVAHNSKFDVGFIVYDMHNKELPFFSSDVYCSCKLSRKFVSKAENHKLNTLAEFFNVPLENHHRALDDTFACLKVFAQTLLKLKKDAHLKEGHLLNLKDFEKTPFVEIPEKLRGIIDHLEKQTPIEIKYKGGSMKGQFRLVRPVSILTLPQGNILYAHCLKSDIYKSFSLKKITDWREIEE
jgi:DNA polymerase-3 subunit epsilon